MNRVQYIDKSASMSYDEKIDCAKSSARLFVNSYWLDDRIGLVVFEEPKDSRLVQQMEEVSAIRGTILDLIDALGWWGGPIVMALYSLLGGILIA